MPHFIGSPMVRDIQSIATQDDKESHGVRCSGEDISKRHIANKYHVVTYCYICHLIEQMEIKHH